VLPVLSGCESAPLTAGLAADLPYKQEQPTRAIRAPCFVPVPHGVGGGAAVCCILLVHKDRCILYLKMLR